MSEEELIWVEVGYCVAVSSTNVREITYTGFKVSRCPENDENHGSTSDR